MTTHEIIIIEAGEDHFREIERLDPVETLTEAKQAAQAAGYTVYDGMCETNNTWDGPVDEDGRKDEYLGTPRTYHLVTVLPKGD